MMVSKVYNIDMVEHILLYIRMAGQTLENISIKVNNA